MRAVNNIASMLERTAKRYPTAIAIANQDGPVLTYREMAAWVPQLAADLLWSAKPGECVAIVSENCQLYLPTLFAIWYAGLVAVPINHKLHAKEIDFILKDCKAKIVFGNGCQPEASVNKVAIPVHPVHLDDTAWVFYTSGSTGRPKGVLLSHGNLWAMARAFQIDVKPLTPQDSIVHSCAMSHGSGLYALPHVMAGATNVVVEGAFDAMRIASAMREWHGSTFGPPPALNRILAAKEEACWDDETKDSLIFAGSPLYREDMLRAHDRYCENIIQIYGMAESPCCISSVSAPMYAQIIGTDKETTVGLPQHGMEIMVVNDDGMVSDVGQQGEVIVRGPAVMKGYLNNPEATAKALRNGWLYTGDIGRMDEDGFLYLIDRKSSMIKASGFSVLPGEIEAVLMKHPAVRECAVVGENHPEFGESVAAYIVRASAGHCRADAEIQAELEALCLSNIARFKRPRKFYFVEDLPMGNTGKVLKRALTGR